MELGEGLPGFMESFRGAGEEVPGVAGAGEASLSPWGREPYFTPTPMPSAQGLAAATGGEAGRSAAPVAVAVGARRGGEAGAGAVPVSAQRAGRPARTSKHQCLECGRRFTQASSLLRHRRVHTGERPFTCQECGKGFIQASDLVKHGRVHSGERAFWCPQCGKSFRQPETLAKHRKLVHRGEGAAGSLSLHLNVRQDLLGTSSGSHTQYITEGGNYLTPKASHWDKPGLCSQRDKLGAREQGPDPSHWAKQQVSSVLEEPGTRQDVSGLRDWVKQEESPMVAEEVPGPSEAVTGSFGQIPDLKEEVPHLKEEVPHLKEEVPHLKEEVPHLKEEVPHLNEEVPHLNEEVPHLNEEVPHLNEEVPHLNEEVPHLNEEVPHLNEEDPHLNEEVPDPSDWGNPVKIEPESNEKIPAPSNWGNPLKDEQVTGQFFGMQSSDSFITESRGLEPPGMLDLGCVPRAGVRGREKVALSSPRARVPSERCRFQCLECGRRFTQASSLLRHRRVHTGERPFPCQVCGKGFIQGSDLVKHSRVHSRERAFWCPQCGKRFRQPETLAKHRKLVHRGEDVNNGEFPPLEERNPHLNEADTNPSNWGNPLRDGQFFGMESTGPFIAESRSLEPPGILDVGQGSVLGAGCVSGRGKMEEGKQRQREVGGGQDGAEDTQAVGLEPGKAGLTVSETAFTQVEQCSEVLPWDQRAETEAESQAVPKARSRGPVFWCPQCGADFNSLLGLVRHQRRHRHETGVCKKRFPPQRSHGVQDTPPLQSSMPLSSRPNDRQRRPSKREHRCLECGRRFTQASSLLRHRRVHTGERPFPCQVCGKGFIQGSDLVKHSRVHSGERAFWCPQCGKRFRQPETLAKHRKLLHRGEGVAASPQEQAAGNLSLPLSLLASLNLPQDLLGTARGSDAQCITGEGNSMTPKVSHWSNSGLSSLRDRLGSREQGPDPSHLAKQQVSPGREEPDTSQVVSGLQDWVKQEESALVGEDLPGPREGIPALRGQVPHLNEEVPHLIEEIPDLSNWTNPVKIELETNEKIPDPSDWGSPLRDAPVTAQFLGMESTDSFVAESRDLEPPGVLDSGKGCVSGAGRVRGQEKVALRSLRMRVPSEPRRFLCLECGRRFTQASSLLRHRRVHTGERPFLCQVCGKGFIQASDLVNHSRVHSVERAFWCSQCGKRFRQPELLAKHNRLLHRGEGVRNEEVPHLEERIPHLNEKIRGPSDWENPLRVEPVMGQFFGMGSTGSFNAKNRGLEPPGTLDLGQGYLPGAGRVRARERLEDGKQQQTEGGNVREKVEEDKQWQREAVVGQVGAKDTQAVGLEPGEDGLMVAVMKTACTQVQEHGEVLPQRQRAQTEAESQAVPMARNRSPVFWCSHCGADFNCLLGLVRHQRRHRHEPGVCRKRFTPPSPQGDRAPPQDPSCIQPHSSSRGEQSSMPLASRPSVRQRRPTKREHRCLECGRRFTQASSLLRHRRVHTGERPFSCQVCGKGFIQASDLVKHSRVHSGERAFWCPQCGKSFRQPETLAKHRKLLHRGEGVAASPQKGAGGILSLPLDLPQDLLGTSSGSHTQYITEGGNYLAPKASHWGSPGPSSLWESLGTREQGPDPSHWAKQQVSPVREDPGTSQDVTGCRDWVKQEVCPVVGEEVQVLSEVVKGSHEQVPHLDEEVPHLTEEVPHLTEEVPHLTEEVPHLTEEVPHLTEEVPHLTEEVPHLTEEVPHLTEEVPHLTEEVPHLTEEVPHLTEAVPRLTEEIPHLTEEIPHLTEEIPHLNEEIPHLNEEIPHLNEEIPHLNEEIPHLSNWTNPVKIEPETNEKIPDPSGFGATRKVGLGLGDGAGSVRGQVEVALRSPRERVPSERRRFLCLECGRRFTQASSLLRHRRVHTGERPFLCQVCGKGFIQASDLVKHSRVHSGERAFWCPQCGKRFRQPETLAKHRKLLHGSEGERNGEVPHLEERIQGPNDRGIPLSDKPVTGQFFGMEPTGSFIPDSRCLEPSGMLDLGQGCVMGAASLRGREKVEESKQRQRQVGGDQGVAEDPHAVGLESGETGPTVAVTETAFTRVQQCGEALPQVQQAETESQAVPRASSRAPVFWCPHCGAEFNSLLGLVRHQRRHKHETAMCKKRFPPPSPRGQLSHGVQDTTPPQSSMTLASRPSNRQRRPTKREHRCLECGRRFTQASSLLRHRRVHTGERPFPCQVCGKGFIQASDLVKHSRVHSGERAFWCPQCGKSFRQPETLAKHRKLLHRGQGLAASPQQGVAGKLSLPFSLPPRLNLPQDLLGTAPGSKAVWRNPDFGFNGSHKTVWVCDGQRLFRCLVCGKHLSSSSALSRHHRIHRGDQALKCPERSLGCHHRVEHPLASLRLRPGTRASYSRSTALEALISAIGLSSKSFLSGRRQASARMSLVSETGCDWRHPLRDEPVTGQFFGMESIASFDAESRGLGPLGMFDLEQGCVPGASGVRGREKVVGGKQRQKEGGNVIEKVEESIQRQTEVGGGQGGAEDTQAAGLEPGEAGLTVAVTETVFTRVQEHSEVLPQGQGSETEAESQSVPKARSRIPVFWCPRCGADFNSLLGLVKHQRRHRNEPGLQPAPASACAHRRATLPMPGVWKRLHPGLRPRQTQPCALRGESILVPQCGKSFRQPETLAKHRKLVHRREGVAASGAAGNLSLHLNLPQDVLGTAPSSNTRYIMEGGNYLTPKTSHWGNPGPCSQRDRLGAREQGPDPSHWAKQQVSPVVEEPGTSQGVSGLRDWVKQEECPVVGEEVPSPSDGVTGSHGHVSHLNEEVPHLNEEVPHLNEKIPHFYEEVPHLNEEVPHLNEEVPHLNEDVPQPNEDVPHLNEKIPGPSGWGNPLRNELVTGQFFGIESTDSFIAESQGLEPPGMLDLGCVTGAGGVRGREKAALNSLRERVPSERRRFLCLECGRRFTQASSLLRHRRVHTGERPFTCQVCGKGFIQASDLVKHSRVHSGERAFWCPQCGKRFRQPETLAKHRKLVHRSEGTATSSQPPASGPAPGRYAQVVVECSDAPAPRRFPCLVCGRELNSSSSLLRHQRVCPSGQRLHLGL
ncbi:uncharacterized protein LOC103189828 [Callorhinchus milii]|uniref:uncharacterized protein LOC103189828 n=1 Tax=Callorhinchus milii TaxID=7868 RepID=UPI001C3FE691|nr:uncharacterized protein LOC103189828 [Callorhinchus milii]